MNITLLDQVKLYFAKAGVGNSSFIFIHGVGADTSHLAPQFYFFARRLRSFLHVGSARTSQQYDRRFY